MAETIFVDTGAWYALADKSDQYHVQAVKVYPGLLRSYHHLTTTNLIISETYNLILRSLGHEPAIKFIDNIGASPRVARIYSNNLLEEKAIDILKKCADQLFSYVDAVSFAAMKSQKISKAFAFDAHFIAAGFEIVPSPNSPSPS